MLSVYGSVFSPRSSKCSSTLLVFPFLCVRMAWAEAYPLISIHLVWATRALIPALTDIRITQSLPVFITLETAYRESSKVLHRLDGLNLQHGVTGRRRLSYSKKIILTVIFVTFSGQRSLWLWSFSSQFAGTCGRMQIVSFYSSESPSCFSAVMLKVQLCIQKLGCTWDGMSSADTSSVFQSIWSTWLLLTWSVLCFTIQDCLYFSSQHEIKKQLVINYPLAAVVACKTQAWRSWNSLLTFLPGWGLKSWISWKFSFPTLPAPKKRWCSRPGLWREWG